MNKAYDQFEWDFLEAVMVQLGFQRRWVDMVMRCVKMVEFSILINGWPRNSFKPTKGLRQRDFLSLYPFFIIGEVLSMAIKQVVEQGYIKGIKLSASGLVLSHLLFANDTLIFLMATKENSRNMSSLLEAYCKALRPNTLAQLALELCNILDMPKVDDLGKYLGILTL
ncbi:hypothetical protein ACFX1Q_043980 [Malus domestica]